MKQKHNFQMKLPPRNRGRNAAWLKTGLKIIVAGCVAIVILSVLCIVYCNMPLIIQTTNSVTDNVFEPQHHYSSMVEGFGYGKTNNEGFVNEKDYNGQQIDILIMGSSQMEALQVPQKNATVALLNNLYNGKNFVYNLGRGSHNFNIVCKNYERALSRYNPKNYAVIETGDVQFETETLQSIRRVSVEFGGIYKKSKLLTIIWASLRAPLKRALFVRLIGRKITELIRAKQDAAAVKPKEQVTDKYKNLLNDVMKHIAEVSSEHNTKPLIFYHPHLELNSDGSVAPDTDNDYLAVFKEACINNGIYFLDMTETFMNEYKEHHILPHGFINTHIGAGHLNKHGHRMIANALYDFMEGQ